MSKKQFNININNEALLDAFDEVKETEQLTSIGAAILLLASEAYTARTGKVIPAVIPKRGGRRMPTEVKTQDELDKLKAIIEKAEAK